MRLIPITILLLQFLIASGQVEALQDRIDYPGVIQPSSIPDTIPAVEYVDSSAEVDYPAYFINGRHYDISIMKTLNLQMIDSIDIKYGKAEIKDKTYNGQIHLLMKEEYNPKLISLHDLKLKYIKPSGRPAIFLINNDAINDDYKSYLVDEKYILKIVVDSLVNAEEEINVDIIRLLTRTEENIKETQKISIRGATEHSPPEVILNSF